MKTTLEVISRSWAKSWMSVALCLMAATVMAACGGSEPTPTPTSAPATATSAPADDAEAEEPETEATEETESTEEAEQPESPLSQPGSPLSQPDSPLTTTMAIPRTEDEAIALATMTKAPEPEEGFGTLSGVLYSYGTVPGAIRGTQVYLEPAVELDGKFIPPPVSVGPIVEEGDIFAQSNDLGQVQLENIPPGKYYIAVWTLYNWLLANETAGEEAPRMIEVKAGEPLDLGVLYAKWP